MLSSKADSGMGPRWVGLCWEHVVGVGLWAPMFTLLLVFCSLELELWDPPSCLLLPVLGPRKGAANTSPSSADTRRSSLKVEASLLFGSWFKLRWLVEK